MHQSQAQRAGFSISPLLVIGIIFVVLLAVEALLVARFWLQLAASNTSEGIQALVLDISHPLVAPFADAQATARDVGSFERNTLVAAIAYLVGAVILTIATILVGGVLTGNEMISRQKRRSSLAHLDHQLVDHTEARLIGTATLRLTPEQAERVLRMLHLDRMAPPLFVIPAEGGCIIAAFAPADDGEVHLPLLGRTTREAITVKRALRAIERRFRAYDRHPRSVTT